MTQTPVDTVSVVLGPAPTPTAKGQLFGLEGAVLLQPEGTVIAQFAECPASCVALRERWSLPAT